MEIKISKITVSILRKQLLYFVKIYFDTKYCYTIHLQIGENIYYAVFTSSTKAQRY
jgi:hypothetical protein